MKLRIFLEYLGGRYDITNLGKRRNDLK
jgi:hypothetical protein